jgi:hypothetical protein
MRRLIRRLVLWAVPEVRIQAAPVGSVVYVVGDPFDTETNPRRRQANARKLTEPS